MSLSFPSLQQARELGAKIIITFLQEYNEEIQGSIKSNLYEDHNTEIIPCNNSDQTTFGQSITQGDVSCCQVSNEIEYKPKNKQGFIIFVQGITLLTVLMI